MAELTASKWTKCSPYTPWISALGGAASLMTGLLYLPPHTSEKPSVPTDHEAEWASGPQNRSGQFEERQISVPCRNSNPGSFSLGTTLQWIKKIITRVIMCVINVVFIQYVTMEQSVYTLQCIIITILKAACFGCNRQPTSGFTFPFLFIFLESEVWCLSRAAETYSSLYYYNKVLCIDRWSYSYAKYAICFGTHTHNVNSLHAAESFLRS